MDTENKISDITGKDLLMSAAAAVCGVLSVVWGLWGQFRLGWTITFVLFFVAGNIFLYRKENHAGVYTVSCGIVSFLLSFVFITTSDMTIAFFSFFLMLILASIHFSALCGNMIPSGDTGLIRFALRPMMRSIPAMPGCIRILFTSGNGKNKNITKILLGILCSVPVLCIVIPLLVKSDAAFEGLTGSIFENCFDGIFKTVVSIIVTPFIVSYVLLLAKKPVECKNTGTEKNLDTAFLTAFLAMLSACYVAYLLSQLAYFFSAFSGFLPEGYEFSYAEYARRGFFEICGIAAVNLIIVFISVMTSEKNEKKRMPVPVLICGIFISVFTILLICTALSKMIMYINNYGMTEMRILVSLFLCLMAMIFAAVIIRFFTEKVRILHIALLGGSIILLVCGLVNINSFTAEYNYNAYKTGKLPEIDVYHYEELGKEGIPYLIKLCDDSNKKIAEEAGSCLKSSILTMYDFEYINEVYSDDVKLTEKELTHFFEMDIPTIKAYGMIEEYLESHSVNDM